MNDNKHKVAFYFVLVILLGTLSHCHGSKKDVTEVFSHTTRVFPKSTIEFSSLSEMKKSYMNKSISEKFEDICRLFNSLLFDWNLNGESAGRTFGGLRMRKLLVPAAFLGGFLTAVIIGIKIIGVINMLLITGVLVLNLGVILGKLFFAKIDKYGLNGPHGSQYYGPHRSYPPYGYDSYGYADSRVDSSLPFRRNFNSPSFFSKPEVFQTAFLDDNSNHPTNYDQIPERYNKLSIMQPQLLTDFQPQLQNIDSNLLSTIQMKTPPQVLTIPDQVGSPYQFQKTNKMRNLSDEDKQMENNYQIRNTINPIVSEIRINSTASPAEIQSTISPLDILNDVLARMGEKKKEPESVPQLVRFKRKTPSYHHFQHSSIKPFL